MSLRRARRRGPEDPSLTELIVNAIPLPYPVACALLAIVVSTLGGLLANYAELGNLEAAWQSLRPPGASEVTWLASIILSTIAVFYLLYSPGYMRRLVLRSKPHVTPLLPDGEEDFRKAFRRISFLGSPLAIGGALIFLYFFFLFSAAPLSGPGASAALYYILSLAFIIPAVGTYVWVYATALAGINFVGRLPLKLKPHYVDAMFGLGPLGALCLSLAGAYFLGVLLSALSAVIFPEPGSLLLVSSFIIVGVAMVFLPLAGVHRVMLREKHRAENAINVQLAERIEEDPPGSTSEATLADLRRLLADLSRVMTLDIAKRGISGVPTWPFDTRVLGRLAALAASIAVILVARIIAGQFGI